jgi:predicted transcriptional regulator
MAVATKPLTVRLPADLYDRSTEVAKRRRLSMNALIQEGLAAIMREEEYQRLYDAFGELGEDLEEADVAFAAHAQWEVVSRGES